MFNLLLFFYLFYHSSGKNCKSAHKWYITCSELLSLLDSIWQSYTVSYWNSWDFMSTKLLIPMWGWSIMGKVSDVMLLVPLFCAQRLLSAQDLSLFSPPLKAIFFNWALVSAFFCTQTPSLHLLAERPLFIHSHLFDHDYADFPFFLIYRFIDLNISQDVKKGPIFKVVVFFLRHLFFIS